MRANIVRFVLIVGAALAASFASAFTFSNLQSAGDPGLVGIASGQVLTTSGNTIGPLASGIIDFFPTNAAVGDGTSQASLTYTFQYDVLSTFNINSVGLAVLGTIGGRGTLSIQEQVFQLVAGNVVGGPLVNYNASFNSATVDPRLSFSGSNFTFNEPTIGPFTSPQLNYRVVKTFHLDVPANWNPPADFVSLNLIEQNQQPVPEPATMAALTLGIGALVARRRKR